jgi:hypothetical protein
MRPEEMSYQEYKAWREKLKTRGKYDAFIKGPHVLLSKQTSRLHVFHGQLSVGIKEYENQSFKNHRDVIDQMIDGVRTSPPLRKNHEYFWLGRL